MKRHRLWMGCLAMLCAAAGSAPAQGLLPGLALLSIGSPGTQPTPAAPEAVAATARVAVVEARWEPATAAAMERLRQNEAQERAHMWDIFRAVVAPAPGGAACFETWYTRQELLATENVSPTAATAPAGRSVDTQALYNTAAYRFVRDNGLWRLPVVQALRRADRRAGIPALPRDSIVVKPLFESVPDSDPEREQKLKTHYWCKDSTGYLILVSLHVITHELDTWAWPSFWWVDNPKSHRLARERPDTELAAMTHQTRVGEKIVELRGVFTNYVMKTALDYFERGTRNPRICANPNIETLSQGGPESNCISCHQAATFPRFSRWEHTTGRMEDNDPYLVGNVQMDYLWFLTRPANVR